ncbi:MAG: lysophospholipid acyltransferase family protein [Campylobacterales bacterium]|nr:lysophospholipid acyltransferase family protein [Campylobacterales bacterium]
MQVYLQTRIVPFLLQLIVRLIYLSCKKRFFISKNIPKDRSMIVAMWHGDLIMQPFNYKNFKKNGVVKAIISEHRDGETISKTMEFLGIGTLSGSSTRGGVKAMIGAMKALKNGIDVAITPDGPRGPIYSIADGIVAIAQKTNSIILPFSSVPSRYWIFNSWDKFVIPKPFCQIDFYIQDPVEIQNKEFEDAKKILLEAMMKNQLEK